MNDQDFRIPFHARAGNLAPMVLNPHSHPAYAPVKLNVKTANDVKLSKSRAPEKPIAPYMRYSKKVWDSVKMQNPEAKLWEIGKIVGNMWRDLNEHDKQEYFAEYEHQKAEYCEQLKAYHNSPQYQNFLLNSSRKRDLKGNMNSGALMNSNIINTMNNNGRTAGIADAANSHYAIEPAEDDSLDDSLSIRQQTLQRYTRNHKLLNEIFNEYTVADNRSMITTQRMDQLKKQVSSLEMHQKKLADELKSIEEKHELKKRKITESSENFDNELTKLNEFKVTEDELKGFYKKNYEQLENQWSELDEKRDKTNQDNIKAWEFKMSLDNLVTNNKALMTIPAPSYVSLVALQQAVESTPPPTAPVVASAPTTAPESTSVAAPATAPVPAPAAPVTAPGSTSVAAPAMAPVTAPVAAPTIAQAPAKVPTPSSTPVPAPQAVAPTTAPNQTVPPPGAPQHPHGTPGQFYPGQQQPPAMPNQQMTPQMYNHQQQMMHHQQQMMHGPHQQPPVPAGQPQHPPGYNQHGPMPQQPAPAPGTPHTQPGVAQQGPTPQPPQQQQPQYPPQGQIPPQQLHAPIQHTQPQQPHMAPGQTMLPQQQTPQPIPGAEQYPGYNQAQSQQGYPPNPAGYPVPVNQPNAMYPGQQPMYQQYGMQQQYTMQRPQGPYMAPQPGQVAPPQQMMGMRPQMPAAGQPNPAYPYMMGQPQFNQQQQFRSTNTPPTNPATNMASPVQPSQPPNQATTPNPAPGTPTPNQQSANQQSPIVNRMQPQAQPNQMPPQQQPVQIRPTGPQGMNYYNGQMPMYGMNQQQGQFPQQHPNMMQQSVPGGVPLNQQYMPQQQMMYPNPQQQPGQMPYQMQPGMNPQQGMMMQQQQHPGMYNMYPQQPGQQQPQPGMPVQQQPQTPMAPINNSPTQSPAPSETKAKGKKKEKKAKASKEAESS